MNGRAAAALVGLAAAITFVGCYGSTEPATRIEPTSATLNGHGTANNGPATAYFEYWLTDGSGSTQQTDPLHFPGGSHGDFSTDVTGLTPESSYSFRLCGSDDSGGPTLCAQTRTFQTLDIPTEDSVTGDFDLGAIAAGTIDAHSGPSGENPHGHISYHGFVDDWASFEGDVTCVAVDGHRGAVGAVGEGVPVSGPSDPQPLTLLATVEDKQGVDADTIFGIFTEGSTPPDCASATYEFQTELTGGGDLVVRDAQPSEPTAAR